MDLNRICAAVTQDFAETGASTPPWPDPHPDRDPAKDEYSRCLDPAKYRIVGARADAWLRALDRLGLATVAQADDPGAAWRDEPPRGAPTTQAAWARPHQLGSIPLLFSFRAFNGVQDNLVTLGAGEPAVEIATIPDCGCDACDAGSADLLEVLDDRVLDVVSGQFVHVTTEQGTAQGYRDGWEASGFGGQHRLIEQVLADARTGRSSHRVIRGARWW